MTIIIGNALDTSGDFLVKSVERRGKSGTAQRRVGTGRGGGSQVAVSLTSNGEDEICAMTSNAHVVCLNVTSIQGANSGVMAI